MRAVCERALMMITLRAINEMDFWIAAGSGYEAYGSCGKSDGVSRE
jgi:hypothetical protein